MSDINLGHGLDLSIAYAKTRCGKYRHAEFTATPDAGASWS